MAVMKTSDYAVVHPSLCLAVGGKLQEMPVGAIISLSAEAAKSLLARGMIKPVGAEKRIAITEADVTVK
jgi:hypothetical protein